MPTISVTPTLLDKLKSRLSSVYPDAVFEPKCTSVSPDGRTSFGPVFLDVLNIANYTRMDSWAIKGLMFDVELLKHNLSTPGDYMVFGVITTSGRCAFSIIPKRDIEKAIARNSRKWKSNLLVARSGNMSLLASRMMLYIRRRAWTLLRSV